MLFNLSADACGIGTFCTDGFPEAENSAMQHIRDCAILDLHKLVCPKKLEVFMCWVSVKQFSRNDTATALSGLVTSTRLGRGSIKSHVCTVKVLGMGLFAFQERVRLWQGVTH